MKLEVVPLLTLGDFVIVLSEVDLDSGVSADQLHLFKREAGARALLLTSEPVEVVR